MPELTKILNKGMLDVGYSVRSGVAADVIVSTTLFGQI